ADQVVSVWAGINGHFDDVPVADVLRFESELLDYLRRRTDILSTIAETGNWDDDTANAVVKAIAEFKGQFRASGDHGLAAEEKGHKPLGDEDISVETIQTQKD
ncbi:MAG: F0F1 ATP synthase subunit alpha, partial [Propionibacterium sp.]|nr:F0F1 ATP synthase subunit alpha [Propionibacterium sp.]